MPTTLNLLDFLSPAAVKVPLAARDKRGAINELIELLGSTGAVDDVEALKRVVWEREKQRSTGIGEGLAIPHGRSDCTKALVMAVGRPAVPIEFDSIDRKPVELIVLLASPPDKTSDHIQTLGRVARMMADADTRRAAFSATTSNELYELFKERGAS